MSQPSLSRQIHLLATALSNSGKILYQTHEQFFKIVLLLLISYIAFKIGRATVTDPLDSQVKSINQTLKNRQHYTIYLPKKIKQIAKTRRFLFVLLLIVSSAGGVLYWMKHGLLMKRSKQELQIAGVSLGVLFLAVIGVWIHQKIIGFMMKKGRFNDNLIHQKLTKIVTSFGKKTQLLLKGYLCIQKFRKRQNVPSTICTKQKCKKHRVLLKQRSDVFSRIIDSVMSFEWCSCCKKKIPFDEYLPFEAKVYEKNEDNTEEKDVSERNQFLLLQIERMTKWVHSIGPCNCSKRYWLESTRSIRQFKKDEKAIKQQLYSYQQASPSK